jgi:hypothetical protein
LGLRLASSNAFKDEILKLQANPPKSSATEEESKIIRKNKSILIIKL